MKQHNSRAGQGLKRAVLCATAAGIVTGTVVPLPTAQAAAADCTVAGGSMRLHMSNDYDVTVAADGSSINDPWAQVSGGLQGVALGAITGRTVDFRIQWRLDANPPLAAHFTGSVGSDGIAHGSATGPAVAGWAPADWTAITALNCPPAQGPTVSWDPTLGGLVAHISDRSGVTAQCTYRSDFYTRGFALPANSTYDLRIVPAVPQFRNWDVSITCDNGATTKTTEFF